MSKKISFVCSDELYVHIEEYMKVESTSNMSFAIRILLLDGLIEYYKPKGEYISKFARYIDCLSADDILGFEENEEIS